MTAEHDKFLRLGLEQACKIFQEVDVPVGAVVAIMLSKDLAVSAECLNAHWFMCLADAKEKCAA